MDSIIHLIPARRITGSVAAKRTRPGVPGAMLQRLEGGIFGVNGLQFAAIGPSLLTQAAIAQDGRVVADPNIAYAIGKKSEVHLSVANLFDHKYSANSDGFAPRLLSAARIYCAGVRLKHE